DVVAAHVQALTMGRVGQRYVLGSANLTYHDAGTIASSVLGCRAPSFTIPAWLIESMGSACEAVFPLLGRKPSLTRQIAWLSQHCIFFSNEKAVRELHMPVTPFEETVRRTAPYYLGRPSADRLVPV